MLAIQSYVLTSYDERGRLAFRNQFAASCEPVSISQVRYDEDGKKVQELVTWFTPRGIRTVEALYAAPGRTVAMQCDEAGRILEVTGAVPPDLDLPGGWGRELGGLSLRLAASRERGRPSQLGLILSLRNRGDSEGSRGLTADAYAPVELRGADGRIVPRVQPPNEFEGHACDQPQALGPARDEIAHVREYDIEEIWGRLPPGTYGRGPALPAGERGVPRLQHRRVHRRPVAP